MIYERQAGTGRQWEIKSTMLLEAAGTPLAAAPPQSSGMVGQPYSKPLNYLRGIAAVCVLIHHVSAYLLVNFNDATLFSITGQNFGVAGVAIFFAISGLLMAEIVRNASPSKFLISRVVRIYPTYFIIAGAAWLLGSLQGNQPPVHFYTALLAPTGQGTPYVLGVEWTLIFEMSFYVLLFFVSAARILKHLNGIAVGWVALLIVSWLLGAASTPYLVTAGQVPIAAASAAFAGGLLVPVLIKRGFRPVYFLSFALGAMALTGFSEATERMLLAVAATIVVAWAFTTELPSVPRFIRRAMGWLGTVSYALYLCHVPIIRFIYGHGHGLPHLFLAALAFAAALIVAALFGRMDVSLHAWMKTHVKGLDPQLVNIAAVSFSVVFAAAAFGSFFFAV